MFRPMPRRATALGAALALTVALMLAPAAAADATGEPAGTDRTLTTSWVGPGTVTDCPVSVTSARRTMLAGVNEERARVGLLPVVAHTELDRVAQEWATTMASTGEYKHSPDYWQRYPSGWTGYGENIASGHVSADTPRRFHRLWVGSPGHYYNMLQGRWTHLGLGFACADTPHGTVAYGVQNYAAYPTATPRPTVSFTDVGTLHPFYREIEWFTANGVSSGYDDYTFRPTATSTRQAAAAFFYRQAGQPDFVPPRIPTFTDVPTNHRFYLEIEWLAQSGIASGHRDGTFRPSEQLTRQAIAAFFYRHARPPAVPTAAGGFDDVPANHPFYREITWMAQSGITTGFDDNTYRPAGTLARQATAAFFYRSENL